MNLKLSHKVPGLKVVYTLFDELRDDPDQVLAVQSLSLDRNKPFMGLAPVHGLFGSEEWWDNIRSGKITTFCTTGIIEKLEFSGQDSRWGDSTNAFTFRQDDGVTSLESIYAQDKQDRKLFCVGARVSCWYALLELKSQPAPDGGVNYARTLLEMAVSA